MHGAALQDREFEVSCLLSWAALEDVLSLEVLKFVRAPGKSQRPRRKLGLASCQLVFFDFIRRTGGDPHAAGSAANRQVHAAVRFHVGAMRQQSPNRGRGLLEMFVAASAWTLKQPK